MALPPESRRYPSRIKEKAMGLASKRFAAVQRLQAASNNKPPIGYGEQGEAVRVLQMAFISLNFDMPISTKHYTALPDGIFGAETKTTVKAFQAKHGLVQDGIVGRDTLGKLDQIFSSAVDCSCHGCANCYQHVGPFTPPQLIQAAFSGSSSGPTAKLPTKVRLMTSAEERKADTVFGHSLVYSGILISNGLGLNGRAFVSIVPTPITIATGGLKSLCIVNWGDSPSDGTFFHELTHVWQSQHHITSSAAFMVNAVLSQEVGAAAGGSAYAFIPGRFFVRYGAEQIAQQVERGKADIINHIKAVPPLVLDPTNIPVPGIPFWETPGAPGVET
jgi:peptidoglycan hydrolase-like protein with peptidoglycan-binding domain